MRICLHASLDACTRSTNGALCLSFCVPTSLITIFGSAGIFCLLSIAYVLRPRLRPRLTLSGRTFLRKPWAFGGGDSHSPFATHANILSSVQSTDPRVTASARTECSSTTDLKSILSFGSKFEPRLSSARSHSTSELLRTL